MFIHTNQWALSMVRGCGLSYSFRLSFPLPVLCQPDTIDVKGGTPTSAGEILQMAVSQKAFFGKKGGITFSGGEPTLQAEALIPLFKDLKATASISVLTPTAESGTTKLRNC